MIVADSIEKLQIYLDKPNTIDEKMVLNVNTKNKQKYWFSVVTNTAIVKLEIEQIQLVKISNTFGSWITVLEIREPNRNCKINIQENKNDTI